MKHLGDDEFNSSAFEEGLYVWEKVGKWGVEIGVDIKPLKSIEVHIGVGPERHSRMVQTRLRIDICVNGPCNIDLIGNRYNEEYPFFHGKGLATCAVNTAILFLLPFYKQPELHLISGNVSTVDDEGSIEIKMKLIEKRRIFWQRFGFIISTDGHMSCRISDLKCISYGMMLDEFPRLITPDQFSKENEHSSLEELFDKIDGKYPSLRDVVPKDLWNARPNQQPYFMR